MADKEKKKKKKAKEEPPPPPPEPEPEPVPEPPKTPDAKSKASSTRTSRGSKKSKRKESNVFSMFSTGQIAEFKEGFSFIDVDKDGIISKNDLRSCFNQIGKIVPDKELDEMLREAPGPMNFTQYLMLFAARMSGQADEDEVVIAAFRTFDEGDGTIDGEKLRQVLTSFGDKFTQKEVDNAYENFEIDEHGMIDTEDLLDLLVGAQKEDED